MMNKRYTDIDALIAMLRNNIDLHFNGGDSWAHIVQIKDKLIEHIEKNAPVADVAEVVRCSECRYLRVFNAWDIYAKCTRTGRIFLSFKKDTRTHFCSDGKRKDGADNAADI